MKSYEEAKRHYRAGVERLAACCSRLWVSAMRMHRCVGCALIDVDEKMRITRDLADKRNGAGDCPEFCKDQEWLTKVAPAERSVVGGVSGNGGRSGGEVCVLQALEVSLLVGEAFDAGLAVTGCGDCALAMVMKYIERAVDVTRHHIPEGGGREGFRRGCKRCFSDVQGLV